MKQKPHFLDQATPWDIAIYREVCYETARKEFNAILDHYGKKVRFLTFYDLANYYHPEGNGITLFMDRLTYLHQKN